MGQKTFPPRYFLNSLFFFISSPPPGNDNLGKKLFLKSTPCEGLPQTTHFWDAFPPSPHHPEEGLVCFPPATTNPTFFFKQLRGPLTPILVYKLGLFSSPPHLVFVSFISHPLPPPLTSK